MGKVGVVGLFDFGMGNGGPILRVSMIFLVSEGFFLFLFLHLTKHTTNEKMIIKPPPDAEIPMMMLICFLLSLKPISDDVAGSKASIHVKFLVFKMYNCDEVVAGVLIGLLMLPNDTNM